MIAERARKKSSGRMLGIRRKHGCQNGDEPSGNGRRCAGPDRLLSIVMRGFRAGDKKKVGLLVGDKLD